MRNPNTLNSDAVSQNGDVADTLDNLRENIMSRVYNLMTTYDNFTEFETYAWQSSSNSGTDSLESVHDLIHGVTGGDGHMTYLDYSAFDPLFMLHHAMVDRLFAIWQALHPDSYVEPMVSNEQTFTTAVGQTLDGATRKLIPPGDVRFSSTMLTCLHSHGSLPFRCQRRQMDRRWRSGH